MIRGPTGSLPSRACAASSTHAGRSSDSPPRAAAGSDPRVIKPRSATTKSDMFDQPTGVCALPTNPVQWFRR
jgi:hypothetical protein